MAGSAAPVKQALSCWHEWECRAPVFAPALRRVAHHVFMSFNRVTNRHDPEQLTFTHGMDGDS
jgi:hypothetical protein